MTGDSVLSRSSLRKSRSASAASDSSRDVLGILGYFDADSEEPTAAWPAASRAVSTRNGEQLT